MRVRAVHKQKYNLIPTLCFMSELNHCLCPRQAAVAVFGSVMGAGKTGHVQELYAPNKDREKE